MKEVKMFLINIQSHKNTCITLKPGLTLLVAKDNNVGKSTVMRALDLIVQIHHLKSEDIRPMLRYGAEEGIIHCEFDDQIVELHIFLSNTTVKYYFLQQKDGIVTQLDKAPKDLIQALNLIAPDDIKQTLNLIEADKYQVIIEEGNVNDSVISFLFTDQMVEHMKENAVLFSNLLNGESSFYNNALEREKERLSSLNFNYYVDQFNEDKNLLTLMSRFVDALPDYRFLKNPSVTSNNLKRLEQILNLSELIRSLKAPSLSSKNVEHLIAIFNLITILNHLKEALSSSAISKINLEHLKDLLSSAQTLLQFSKLLNQYQTLLHNTNKLSIEMSELFEQLLKSNVTVICPVKGEVLYHEKGCIPTSN